ncbi:unnamed protein product [Tetraodon nigroviridis]|uniref:Phosphatidylinositol-glycan biosynthesis class W protein n=1 Tax=Tetraodon nigroviridis TaxID=99883 RepID=Q4SLE5_TETNG|nr:unnamed protein product [Tetraodon nigroviridis]
MFQREQKEAFVSNLNGTSLQEVALGSLIAPLCFLNRGLVMILYYQAQGTLVFPLPQVSHLLLDFSLLVLPVVLSSTVLSSVLHHVTVGLVAVSAGLCCYINSGHQQNPPGPFLQSRVRFQQVPFVTVSRVFVNVITAISILAVDFPVFPRRYAKTETYGTGIMDFGVGAYVFANALVCPEARKRNDAGSKTENLRKQLTSVWPLVVLGFLRLVSIRMTGYPEHVTEYGLHWNFFFTLAIVRVAASLVFAVFPAGCSWVLAILISGFYQFVLESSGLKAFIFHSTDRHSSFLHANREGVFSVLGYVAIYMAGVQVGLYLMQPRMRVIDWLRAIFRLLLGSFVLYVALYLCQTLLEPVSRRLANLPFCVWSVAQSLLFISSLGVADVVLLFSRRMLDCQSLPSSWNLSKTPMASEKKPVGTEHCLVRAISRNQLLFFLVANVLTGLTNSTVDTLTCSSAFSVCVLFTYMFTNCFVMHVLHLCRITVKFW